MLDYFSSLIQIKITVMKYEELIKWCKKTIKLYNPVIDTIDTHTERFLKKVRKVPNQ